MVGLITAVAAAAVAAATGRWVSAAAGALATLAVIIFIGVYNRVSKPMNTVLTAAALADQVPRDARQLQARWGLGHQRTCRASDHRTHRTLRRGRRSLILTAHS